MLAVAIAVMIGRGGVARATTSEQCGDADLNGARTVTDGVLVLRSAAELASGCQVSSRCDVDGNGAVTVTDGVAVLRLAAELPATPNCRHSVGDRSDFSFFSFVRSSAFGFCPPLDSVSRVLLDRIDGQVQVRAAVITEGTAGSPECLSDTTTVPPVACAVEIELPARMLTPDEVARVDAAFSTVIQEQQRSPECGRAPIEPCLLDQFTWDASSITDFACGAPRLLPDQAEALIEVLSSLR